jgi:membrane protease YdiL (CAAX protease family)
MTSTRSAISAINQQLGFGWRKLPLPTVSNWDLAIFVILLSTWCVVAQVGRLIGLIPVLLIIGASVLMSLGGFCQWYSCPALRALGWELPRRRFFGIAIIAGLATAFAVSLIVRAAGMRIIGEPAWLAVLIVTVGPIVEESFFRGFLQPCMGAIVGAMPAVIVAGVCFAAIHGPVTMLQVSCFTVTGIAYGLLRLRSGTIAAPIVMHATYNLSLLFFS